MLDANLHWLPVRYRIQFKSLVFIYKALNELAPAYITDLLHSFFPIGIYVIRIIRISRQKFATFYEYFKNKLQAEILKRI